MLVFAAVSSKNMKRVESIKRWAMRRKNPRFRATSVRVCSSAIKLFFESQIKARQRPVDGGFADLRPAARDDLVGDLRQRQIRRFVDDGSDHVIAFDESRLPRTANLLRVDGVRLDELPDDLYHRRMGDGEPLPLIFVMPSIRTACTNFSRRSFDSGFISFPRRGELSSNHESMQAGIDLSRRQNRRASLSRERNMAFSRTLAIREAFVISAAVGLSTFALAPPARAVDCEGLKTAAIADTTIVSGLRYAADALMIANKAIAAGDLVTTDKVTRNNVPAFCRVVASVKSAPDSDVRIELWLPKEVGMGALWPTEAAATGRDLPTITQRWRSSSSEDTPPRKPIWERRPQRH